LAEEAVGLVKSLGWEMVKGPVWDVLKEEDEEETEELMKGVDKDEEIETKRDQIRSAFEEGISREPVMFSRQENARNFRKEGI
jgi:hypothetical protein